MINQDVLNLHTLCANGKGVLDCIKIEDKQSIAANGNILGIVSNPTNVDENYPLTDGKTLVKETLIKAKTAKNFKILKAGKYKKDLENIVLLKKDNTENIINLFNTNLDSSQSTEEIVEQGNYPAYQDILPSKEPVLRMQFNINELKTMIDYLNKFDTRDNPFVTLAFYGKNEAMKLECIIPDEKQFTGLVMPIES